MKMVKHPSCKKPFSFFPPFDFAFICMYIFLLDLWRFEAKSIECTSLSIYKTTGNYGCVKHPPAPVLLRYICVLTGDVAVCSAPF